MTEPIFNHNRLDVYPLSIEYVSSLFGIAKDLGGCHCHTRDQWLRTARSIPLNIAEENRIRCSRKNRIATFVSGFRNLGHYRKWRNCVDCGCNLVWVRKPYVCKCFCGDGSDGCVTSYRDITRNGSRFALETAIRMVVFYCFAVHRGFRGSVHLHGARVRTD